jgi:hypothetical protein
LDWENLNMMPWFVERQEALKDGQKLVVDQFQHARAMYYVNLGLHQLCLAFRKTKLISDPNLQYDDNEKTQNIRENNYNQRFKNFVKAWYPPFKDFHSQTEHMAQEGEPDELYDLAKQNLTQARQILNTLENTPATNRNTVFFQNEQLKEM